jgi:hypothetical protein
MPLHQHRKGVVVAVLGEPSQQLAVGWLIRGRGETPPEISQGLAESSVGHDDHRVRFP